MKKNKIHFDMVDMLLCALIILPYIFGMALKVLTTPESQGISVTGARIYFTIDMPLQKLPITEAQVNSLLVIISLLGLCLFLTRGLKTKNIGIRQHIAEWIVSTTEKLVYTNMGEFFSFFGPFIAAILGLSALSSLLSLLGLYPPTSDINIVAGWAILVFVLITYYKSKAGIVCYIKSFASPVAMAPLNIISEIATPISMAFRHYGNILSGTVISVLLAAGLSGLSNLIFGWLPGFIGDFPFFRIGIPAVLSLYFDIFSGLLQAYIFAMLTMMYISGGFPFEEYKRKNLTLNKKYGGN